MREESGKSGGTNGTNGTSGTSVFEVLGASRARLERMCALGAGLRLAQWYNSDDAPSYSAPGHHTLSVYLAGGFGTHTAEHPERRGSPGRVCILPAEHASRWIVEGELRFLHLYVTDLAWAERIVRLLDSEPRALTLDERIYFSDDVLATWARLLAGADWDDADARLCIDGASNAVLDRLVLDAARPAARASALRCRGGLAAAARRRVVDWIEANLHTHFTLADLAAQAALSEFHFARMFRVSFGVTPHAWVARRRLARACALLAGGRLPLERVAAECGYASASHLNRCFRNGYALTPADYRDRRQAVAIVGGGIGAGAARR